jgi:hypothetical protein
MRSRRFLDAAATKPSAEFPLRRSGDVWHVAISNLARSGVRYGAQSRRDPARCAALTAHRRRAGFKVRGDGGWETGNRWYPDVVLLDPCVPPCALSRFRDMPLPLLAARIAAFCASDAIPCVFPARRYAPLVAGRDKFADKAFPPGPGRFTGTFDFASAPVRAVHDVIVQRVLRRAVSARAVRLARGGAAGPPRRVKQLPPARCTRVLRLHPAACACRERLDYL